jgi:RNA-directed DNA polymerase
VSGKRQKNRKSTVFDTRVGGEAADGVYEGIEPPMTATNPESLAGTERLMEDVLERENLKDALKRVIKNGGAPGIDGMTVDELPEYLKANWQSIRNQLLEGSYRPKPVRRVEIPKPGSDKKRKLGIPSCVDRFVQQALQQVLQVKWDRTFSNHSYGFRPRKSAHQAIAKAQEYIEQGYRYVVDFDLASFFDRINHDVLMGLVTKRIKDRRVIKLIRAFLNAGVMENGLVKPTEEGAPQGGPLSPILSNLMLHELDRELETREHKFVRYADDSNVYVRTKRAGERVMVSVTKFLEKRLRLQVNKEKSAVARPWERKFLGFSFTNHKLPKRRITPQALARVKQRIREITCRKRGHTLEQIIKELKTYLDGWLGYFGVCETPSVLEHLEKWIRRKLRCLIWKRWKTGGTRYTKLRQFGLTQTQAAEGAGDGKHGPWHMSRTPPINQALSMKYFESLGLPRLRCCSPA